MKLLQPIKIGSITVANRVAMAPLTRGRATEDSVPTPVMATYYEQRANAGLIVSEATGISRSGLGWFCAPGIWSQEQVEAWKPVTKAVHDKNGRIALQLWHMGRQAHSDVTGSPIVSASDIPVEGEVTARNGEKKPYEVPTPLTLDGIKGVVADYASAAKNAISAGFDMVEVHSANGYLLDQFLQTRTNKRTDAYGGSLENRLRLLTEVVDAVIDEVGADKVGVRLSPNGKFGDMGSDDNIETFTAAIKLLGERKVAYIHVMDGLGFGFHELTEPFTLRMARDIVEKTAGVGYTRIMGNVGYTKDAAEERLQAGDADMIAFGRPYISTPDLVQRFSLGAELNPDAPYESWWGIGLGAKGYTDFPTLDEVAAEKKAEAAKPAEEQQPISQSS